MKFMIIFFLLISSAFADSYHPDTRGVARAWAEAYTGGTTPWADSHSPLTDSCSISLDKKTIFCPQFGMYERQGSMDESQRNQFEKDNTDCFLCGRREQVNPSEVSPQ